MSSRQVSERKFVYVEEEKTLDDKFDDVLNNPYGCIKEIGLVVELTRQIIIVQMKEYILELEQSLNEHDSRFAQKLKTVNVYEMNRYDIFIECCRFGLIRQLEVIYEPQYLREEDGRCLRCACKRGKEQVVRFLCSKGAFNPSVRKGRSPLYSCIMEENTNILEIVLLHAPGNPKDFIKRDCHHLLRKSIMEKKRRSVITLINLLGLDSFHRKSRNSIVILKDFQMYPYAGNSNETEVLRILGEKEWPTLSVPRKANYLKIQIFQRFTNPIIDYEREDSKPIPGKSTIECYVATRSSNQQKKEVFMNINVLGQKNGFVLDEE